MCSLLVNVNIVNMYTWTFFKKGLLAFKTTLKISPVSTFHWKKKKKQRVCNINKLLYNKQYTRRHHIGGVSFFLPVEMDKIVKQSRLWVKFRVRLSHCLMELLYPWRGAFPLFKFKYISAVSLKKRKKRSNFFTNWIHLSLPPQTILRQILRKQSK